MSTSVNLDKDQTALVRLIVDSPGNFFVTGAAGTGKSEILRAVVGEFTARNIVVQTVASYALPACHSGGRTIHSYFHIPVQNPPAHALSRRHKPLPPDPFPDVFIIDEISTVPLKLFHAMIDRVKQWAGSSDTFEKLRFIVFGDFMQLRPIVRSEDSTFVGPHGELLQNGPVINTDLWKTFNFETHVLKRLYRQGTDEKFATFLSNMRAGILGREDVSRLLRRVLIAPPEELHGLWPNNIMPTFLYGHRETVERTNTDQLNKCAGQKHLVMWQDGFFKNGLWNGQPTSEARRLAQLFRESIGFSQEFHLCVGAQVMVRANINPAEQLCNGSRGVITDLQLNAQGRIYSVKIITRAGREKTIELWKFKTDLNGTPFQYILETVPLTPAWAITVHKSQGLTLEMVGINLDEANIFEKNQSYVALSRAREFGSVYLVNVALRSLFMIENMLDDDDDAEHKPLVASSDLHPESYVAFDFDRLSTAPLDKISRAITSHRTHPQTQKIITCKHYDLCTSRADFLVCEDRKSVIGVAEDGCLRGELKQTVVVDLEANVEYKLPFMLLPADKITAGAKPARESPGGGGDDESDLLVRSLVLRRADQPDTSCAAINLFFGVRGKSLVETSIKWPAASRALVLTGLFVPSHGYMMSDNSCRIVVHQLKSKTA